jgi:hypothetical protein
MWNYGREWPSNFGEMRIFTPFRDLLLATNLRHGANGFTSLSKEGMLRIFSPEKSEGIGLNPRTRVPEASILTTRPPKPQMNYRKAGKTSSVVVPTNLSIHVFGSYKVRVSTDILASVNNLLVYRAAETTASVWRCL